MTADPALRHGRFDVGLREGREALKPRRGRGGSRGGGGAESGERGVPTPVGGLGETVGAALAEGGHREATVSRCEAGEPHLVAELPAERRAVVVGGAEHRRVRQDPVREDRPVLIVAVRVVDPRVQEQVADEVIRGSRQIRVRHVPGGRQDVRLAECGHHPLDRVLRLDEAVLLLPERVLVVVELQELVPVNHEDLRSERLEDVGEHHTGVAIAHGQSRPRVREAEQPRELRDDHLRPVFSGSRPRPLPEPERVVRCAEPLLVLRPHRLGPVRRPVGDVQARAAAAHGVVSSIRSAASTRRGRVRCRAMPSQ